jgi:glucose-1-phosphate cytidylyltransferase
MKAVILAGGLGTRLAEETSVRPKPMVEIGGKPLLWHIMQIFARHGINEFIICLGYKGYMIKEFFLNYRLHLSDVTIDLKDGSVDFHRTVGEDWKVTLIETGDSTMTGGRLKRVQKYVGDDTFFMTYGDGLADVDLTELRNFHEKKGLSATVTAVTPPARWGVLELDKERVASFREKPEGENNRISGGFFVLSPKVFELIEGDATIWEKEPLERLSKAGQLAAYEHNGFWQPVDTLRDKQLVESLWSEGRAPWKVW